MHQVKDMTGQRFGRLVVVGREGSYVDPLTGYKVEAVWRCRCDCGAESFVRGRHLRAGLVRSCGCLRAELLRERLKALRAKARNARTGGDGIPCGESGGRHG